VKTLYRDASSLVLPGEAFGQLEVIENGAFLVEDGKISWVGDTSAAPDADEQVSLAGRSVIPGFVDSHAHLIFAGDRSEEFSYRMAGQPYKSGGINTTVRDTRAATGEERRTEGGGVV